MMTYRYFLSTKYAVWFFIFIILGYFIYQIYHGERGLIAERALEVEYAELKDIYKKIHQDRMSLENKINSLGAGDGQIDADLLEENAKKLGYIAADEIMITD